MEGEGVSVSQLVARDLNMVTGGLTDLESVPWIGALGSAAAEKH